MKQYLKQKLADILLCTALTASLVPVICSGFVLNDLWSQSKAFIVLCSLLLQLLFAMLARRRTTIWLGVSIGAVIAVSVFAYLRVTAPLSDEKANSTFIFALIQLVAALLIFLLSRSRPGTVVLFLAGSLICAGSHFLAYPAPAWCLYVFLAAVAVLFFHRVCTVCAAGAEIGSARTNGALWQSLGLCAAALVISLGIFFGVIAPLHPPTQELKLITELRSMELMQVLGISSKESILDPDLSSDAPTEDREQSDERGAEESDAPDGQKDDAQRDEAPSLSERLQETVSSLWKRSAEAIRYDGAAFSWLWLLLLLPASVIAAYFLRYSAKKRWRKRVQALTREDAVVNYYRFFLSRLGRIGLKKLPDDTLREFAANAHTQLEPFEVCGVSFMELTDTYEKVLYGRCAVSEEEYERFERFYDAFYGAMRQEVGTLRYYLCALRY